MKLMYDGECLGEVVTNHGMTVDEACEILGIDPSAMDEAGNDFLYDYELFSMEY